MIPLRPLSYTVSYILCRYSLHQKHQCDKKNKQLRNYHYTVYINPSLNADIDMTTSNGQITISGISLNMTISEEKHKAGELDDGGNILDLHTSNGNINLRKLEI